MGAAAATGCGKLCPAAGATAAAVEPRPGASVTIVPPPASAAACFGPAASAAAVCATSAAAASALLDLADAAWTGAMLQTPRPLLQVTPDAPWSGQSQPDLQNHTAYAQPEYSAVTASVKAGASRSACGRAAWRAQRLAWHGARERLHALRRREAGCGGTRPQSCTLKVRAKGVYRCVRRMMLAACGGQEGSGHMLLGSPASSAGARAGHGTPCPPAG